MTVFRKFFLSDRCHPSSALLSLLLLVGCSHPPTPASLPSPDAVNGEAALEEVARFVALGPRDSGTPGASRAAAYLLERLRGQGYRALLDGYLSEAPGGARAFANVYGVPPTVSGNTLSNVLATTSQPVVILLSHFDTKTDIAEDFTGANDSGSSTGLLLYLAGLLSASGASSPLVVLAFVDGEECRHQYGPTDGLHGSRHLAQQIEAWGQVDRIRAVIVLDMIGDTHLTVRIPHNTTRTLLKMAFAAAEEEGVRQHFGISSGTILDDHVPFLVRKMPAIDLIDFEYGSAPGLNDYWHTEADTMDKLSAESLATMARVVLRMLEQLAL
ncbi:MAG: M28 family peptidase [Lentisphaerae bacterium]|nr:M28 family peptidase [Lentisphaerota bacterium]